MYVYKYVWDVCMSALTSESGFVCVCVCVRVCVCVCVNVCAHMIDSIQDWKRVTVILVISNVINYTHYLL